MWERRAILAHLLAPLNAVLFRLGNDQVTAAELAGFVTGAASVWLTVLARISDTDAFVTSVWERRYLDQRLALATRVTDYVLENRSRFGAAITDGQKISTEATMSTESE
jgi:hypothetical protein